MTFEKQIMESTCLLGFVLSTACVFIISAVVPRVSPNYETNVVYKEKISEVFV